MTNLNIEDILKQSSENLAAVVISYRVLGLFKNEAKLCMLELMNRRSNGEQFKFEEYINDFVSKNKASINIPSSQEIKKTLMCSITNAMIDFNKNIKEDEEDELED